MAQADAAVKGSIQAAPIIGECVLKLSRSTTYEPPLYLFPELLPQVPQGTPPLSVWDAVADSVNIAASSWRVADATQLIAAGVAAAGAGSTKHSTLADRRPQAMVTLASMIADNRLYAAGLDAAVLEKGAFSSASVITHLAALQRRMGLNDEEGAAIMSNHFINLLAWQKLRELSDSGTYVPSASAECRAGVEEEAAGEEGVRPSSQTAPLSSRKRSRALHEGDDRETWLPSPHPWATEAEMGEAGGSDRFVAAGEVNVEEKVELLSTLTKLYQRPWRTLTSRGEQTDFVVPPGTVNITSPFADNTKVPGALLDPATALGWRPLSSSLDTDYFGGVRVAHNPCFYSVLLSAVKSTSEGSTAVPISTRLPLDELTTYFGREAGAQGAAAVAAAATIPIVGSLASYATHPEVLSRLQFAIVLKPVYEVIRDDRHAGSSASESGAQKQEPANEEEDFSDIIDEEGRGAHRVVVHTKRPHHYTLWLVNYGRNGVRIAGKGWVLGKPCQLHPNDVLIVGNEVELRIEEHHSMVTARAPAASDAPIRAASANSSVVKQEHLGEE